MVVAVDPAGRQTAGATLINLLTFCLAQFKTLSLLFLYPTKQQQQQQHLSSQIKAEIEES